MGAAQGSAPPCPPKGLGSPLGIPAAIRKARFRRLVRGSLLARGFSLFEPAPRRTAQGRPSAGASREPRGCPPQVPDPPCPGQGAYPLESGRSRIGDPSSCLLINRPRSRRAPSPLNPGARGFYRSRGLRVSAARHGRQGRTKPAKTFPLRLAPAGKARALSGFAGFTLSSLDPPRRPAAGQGKPSEPKRGRAGRRRATLSSIRWRESIIHRERKSSWAIAAM